MKRDQEAKQGCGELILKEVMDQDSKELSTKNPLILSCGGIYIPYAHQKAKHLLYHILTTPNDQAPVKVVAGRKPQNVLYLVKQKESMN